MSKVIVTGGAGFIGSYIAEELVRRNYQVVIIDNLSTGKLSNMESISGNRNAEFVQGNITSLSLLRKLFAGADYVFHEAAVSSVPLSVKNPRATHTTNVNGTLNVLLAARDNGVKKVIHASSSAVYGDTMPLIKDENSATDPFSPYAVTKLVGEYYAKVFQKIYGMATVTLRYFNVYGLRQDTKSAYAAVIPVFVTNVLSGKPPMIYGNGEQTRDFVHVKDVAKANVLAAESEATGIFNIGSSVKTTINDLAKLIIKLSGKSDIRPVYVEPRPGDILHSLADITKAGTFGYRPKYTLEDGLKEFIRYLV
jgi:UDP-glucose 4-epimerase